MVPELGVGGVLKGEEARSREGRLVKRERVLLSLLGLVGGDGRICKCQRKSAPPDIWTSCWCGTDACKSPE